MHSELRLENFPSAFRDAMSVRDAIGHDRAAATIPPDGAAWAADTAHEMLGRLSEFCDMSTKSACEIFSALEEEALALIGAVSRLDPWGAWLSRITRADTVVFRPAADSVPREIVRWASARANLIRGRLVARLGADQFFSAEILDHVKALLLTPFSSTENCDGPPLTVVEFSELPLADRRRLNFAVSAFVKRKGLGARIANSRPTCVELAAEVFQLTGFAIDEFLAAHLIRNQRKAKRLTSHEA